MSPKNIFNRVLAVLYGIFSLLMLASAIAAIVHQMPVVTVICVVVALISGYMAAIRWRGKKDPNK